MLFDYCVPRYKCTYIFKTLCKLTHTCGTRVLGAYKFWTTQKLTTLSFSSLLPHVKAMGELPSFSLHLFLPKSSPSPHFFIPLLWDFMILATRALRGRDYFQISTIFIQREFPQALRRLEIEEKEEQGRRRRLELKIPFP